LGALDKGSQLDFVLPDQPEVSRRDLAIDAFSEVPAAKRNPGSQNFDAFHRQMMRQRRDAALI
jgi:hypothetical protein